MDYGEPQGTKIWKYQWDLIHDPQTMLFSWAQDEEEGAMVSENDPILDLIISKAKELNISSSGNIHAVIHCKECSENSGLSELNYQKYDIEGRKPIFVINSVNKRCFAIFYDGTELAIEDKQGQAPVNITIGNNSLTVKYANDFCLNCNIY